MVKGTAIVPPEKIKLIKQLLLVLAIGLILRLAITKLGWRLPSFDNRIFPALLLWSIFWLYWGTAGLNSAPSKTSESSASTYFHQFMLAVAFLLLLFPMPRLTGWFLPPTLHFVWAVALAVQV